MLRSAGGGTESSLADVVGVRRAGADWSVPYYRDRAYRHRLGVTPNEMFYEAVGSAGDPGCGGRQMPSHWGYKPFNIVSKSSPTGTQFLQAVGCAEGIVKAAELGLEGGKGEEVVYDSAGHGSTRWGAFGES